ncbi:hypothetical protein CWE12_13280 [Aliidiomarina sedimenti]|uniref:Transglutaminase-like domain-containing protein n=1 Tax=Aliidiomarina sedimenti TaxID=1933879 RepID=A0ABY0BUP1_9GAMM|nr:hypothetical protein CWE12_13280 [Aliidiomarina sedimenti]
MYADRLLTNVSLLCALLLCLVSASASAELEFQRYADDQGLQLNYRFSDHNGTPVELNVRTERQSFIGTPTNFRPLSSARLQREVHRQLLDFAHQQGWHDIEIQRQGQSLQVIAHQGPAEQQRERINAIQAHQQEAMQQVLARYYYASIQLHAGPDGYTPDHPRIAIESQAALTPFSDAVAAHLEQTSARETLQFLLRWLQQIPYDDMSNRLQSPGAGFITPTRLLYENHGDCDSKVTLLAALFANLHPEVNSHIVYLPGHAVFAVELELEDGDISVPYAGQRLVVADPTGPAAMKVGEVARHYRSALHSGAVTIKDF